MNPTVWTKTRLKFLAHLRSGENITSSDIDEVGSFPVYGGNGIRGYTSSYTHSGEHVLIGRQGALCGNVHRVKGQFWASEHAVVASMLRDTCPSWYAYLAVSMNLGQYSVAAAQPGIAVDRIRELPALAPRPAMQRAIADFLDQKTAAIDALIDKKERIIALLAEKRAALIHRAVTNGLNGNVPMRHSGIPWIGQIPAHWTVGLLRLFARIESGHTPSRQHPEYWIPEECTIPWFSLADVWQLREGRQKYLGETAEHISPAGMANSAARLLPPGTVVLSRTASVGFSGIMPRPMATTQDFVDWVCGPRLEPDYLLWMFRAMGSEFDRLMMGSTHQTIYMPDLRQFRGPLPPVDEQRAIAAHLDREAERVNEMVERALKQLNLLREYRQALITAAVTGQLDIGEPSP